MVVIMSSETLYRSYTIAGSYIYRSSRTTSFIYIAMARELDRAGSSSRRTYFHLDRSRLDNCRARICVHAPLNIAAMVMNTVHSLVKCATY